VLGVLGALGVLTPVAAHDPITTKVTFDREVRAILQARCARCHAPGAPAPMPLTTYEEVRPWARAIKDQILTRRMPIWDAAHGYGAFANDPSLTPLEMAMIAAWVDGGQPRGSRGSTGSLSAVDMAFGRSSTPLTIPPSASQATVGVSAGWIAGWNFEPGDPLVTSATFTSNGGAAIGTWVAGDGPVVLPANAGMRVVSPIRVRIERRKAADYEKPFTPKRSLLRVMTLTQAAARRVWVEEAACGAPRTGRNAAVLAVRPLLGAGASARVWLERPGAPRTIIGWFRDADARYPRAYWLAQATDLPPESRVQADASCRVELTLVR
jgi:hypothetical protein